MKKDYSVLYLVLIFFLCLNFNIISQVIAWSVDYPLTSVGDGPLGLEVDSLGNTFLLVQKWTYSYSGVDYFLIKYDINGNLVWSASYNDTTANVFVQAMAMTKDKFDNLYICGEVQRLYGSGVDAFLIKYSMSGNELWRTEYNSGNDSSYEEKFNDLCVDENANIYVTGHACDIETNNYQVLTAKYGTNGNLNWISFINQFHPICNPNGRKIAVDIAGNTFIAADTNSVNMIVKYDPGGNILQSISILPHENLRDIEIDSDGNLVAIFSSAFGVKKYDNNLVLLWEAPFYTDAANPDILLDENNNIFIGDRFKTARIDPSGVIIWQNNVPGTSLGWGKYGEFYSANDSVYNINPVDGGKIWAITTLPQLNATQFLRVSRDGNILFSKLGEITINSYEVRTSKILPDLEITKPSKGELFISGNVDTIKWTGGSANQMIYIEYSTDGGNTWPGIVDLHIPADSGKWPWDVPDDLLGRHSLLRIVDHSGNEILAISDTFKIKPYIITRVDQNGEYVKYDINTDRWGFGNYRNDVWPSSWWYGRFDYNNGLDPFSQRPYNQLIADSTFYEAFQFDFPDWPAFVRAFGTDACYWYVPLGRYRSTAVLRWKAFSKIWGGSCFGIAAANALAFQYKDEFINKYPDFTSFVYPINIQPADTTVIPVITELFTHQSGNPSIQNDISGNGLKNPTQTIEDLKEMLKKDNTPIRTITMINQSGSGGHTILAYKLKQDEYYENIYYVYVYDNAYPNLLNARIVVDTSHNAGIGLWDPEYAYNDWGGEKGFYLEVTSHLYFSNATLSKVSQDKLPFILSEEELIIETIKETSIVIKDNLGNKTGYINNEVLSEIPGSMPLMIKNGSESPPYGYYLPTDNYSIVMNNFLEDTLNTFFFTGNKSFEYERYGATETQTDRLFFDGGVSVTNPDNESKTIKLLNIVSDTTQMEDRLFVVRHLDLLQNDSVKIENLDNDKLKLISYGSAKDYGIGLEYTSESNFGLFGHLNIELSANTTHTFIPNWSDITNSDLTILVDIENNGTIDDTLYLQNQVTSVGNDQGSLIPTEYKLEQNYPNPFNNSTVIKYSTLKAGVVTLKIYNEIGEEVTTLVNEVKQPGNYEVTFITEKLSSGVYFYQIRAGDFVDTKKMILLR